MTSPPRVTILLSTYNGARFLRAQLDSLVAQDHADWTLLWRDDGSADDTVAILDAFAASRPTGQCRRLVEPEGRVQPTESFMALLREATPTLRPADLIAFADQDDVWLPHKLSRAVAALGACDPAVPGLYSARQVLVDAGLRELALSAPIHPPPGFPASLTQNLATGCTVALNRAACLLVAGSIPSPASLHDWWCYLVVTASGGRFVIDDVPVVLYRQHGGNAVGAPPSRRLRAIAALRRGPGMFMNVLRQNVAALTAQPHLLTETARNDLARIAAALDDGTMPRLRALLLPGLRRQTWAETQLFRLWFMIG